MTIQEEFATIQALKYVSMKAPHQPTKDGMAQVFEIAGRYSDGVQKLSALAGVEGRTS